MPSPQKKRSKTHPASGGASQSDQCKAAQSRDNRRTITQNKRPLECTPSLSDAGASRRSHSTAPTPAGTQTSRGARYRAIKKRNRQRRQRTTDEAANTPTAQLKRKSARQAGEIAPQQSAQYRKDAQRVTVPFFNRSERQRAHAQSGDAEASFFSRI